MAHCPDDRLIRYPIGDSACSDSGGLLRTEPPAAGPRAGRGLRKLSVMACTVTSSSGWLAGWLAGPWPWVGRGSCVTSEQSHGCRRDEGTVLQSTQQVTVNPNRWSVIALVACAVFLHYDVGGLDLPFRPEFYSPSQPCSVSIRVSVYRHSPLNSLSLSQ